MVSFGSSEESDDDEDDVDMYCWCDDLVERALLGGVNPDAVERRKDRRRKRRRVVMVVVVAAVVVVPIKAFSMRLR